MGGVERTNNMATYTCSDCFSEDVCKYNDGVNLYCKGFCPHFTPKSDYVKRERGKWIKQGKDWNCKCSICGGESFYHLDSTPSNFCPNCGADMRKENNNA